MVNENITLSSARTDTQDSRNVVPIASGRYERLKVYSITACLFTFVFAGAAVDQETYVISTYVRQTFLGLAAILSLSVFIGNRTAVNKNATYILLLICILTVIFFPLNEYPEEFIKSFGFSFGAIIVAYLTSATAISEKPKIYDCSIILVFLYVFYLIYAGTLTLDGYIPIIHFSPISSLVDPLDNVTYSQGVTRIFAVGVVAVVFKLIYSRATILRTYLLILVAVTFFVLSLSGGARGEVLFCVATVTLIAARDWKSRVAMSLVLILGVTLLDVLVENFETFLKFPTIARLFYSYEYSDLGGRKELLGESFALLSKEPQCAIFGCGFMYFQDSYGYEYGRYPHNWVMEFVITFGVLPLIFFGMLLCRFLYRNYRQFSGNEKFLLFVALYFFGVSLKSGQVPGEALLYSSLFPIVFSTRPSRPATPEQGGEREYAAPSGNLSPSPDSNSGPFQPPGYAGALPPLKPMP